MAYIASVADDTKNVLGREPFLLRDWAKLHADELLEIVGKLTLRQPGVYET
jgi:NAD(P)H dehydrogenase (quinone)